ncbi:unnamed protein product [Adineta steineri]|uniref:Uncharacterized protein n=1 Tax=Adineta steineri TaxID=433720 RepID=A0A819IP00_9BILA|nr:unnamed protein product [Adineta steineri]
MPSALSSRSPPPPPAPTALGSSFKIPKKMSSPPATPGSTPDSTLGSTPSTQGRRREPSRSPPRAPHRPPSSLGPEKREYLNTTAEAKRFKLYTNEHVVDRDSFSMRIEKVLKKAALPPTRTPEDLRRWKKCAVEFLDWYMECAIELAACDLREKIF